MADHAWGHEEVEGGGMDVNAEPDDVFAALADPTRQRLLEVLADRVEATATVLAAELPVSRQAVVKHLAILDRAGLVVGHRQGREVRYAVRPERLAATARWMARLAADWDNRLAAIKRIAESSEDAGGADGPSA
jgi:DNA-binding transcriptional ArsR family regulator